jgi:hypothetical protein
MDRSAAASGLMLPLFGAISAGFLYLLLIPGGLWIVVKGFSLLAPQATTARALSTFRVINGYALLVMSLLSIQNLLR